LKLDGTVEISSLWFYYNSSYSSTVTLGESLSGSIGVILKPSNSSSSFSNLITLSDDQTSLSDTQVSCFTSIIDSDGGSYTLQNDGSVSLNVVNQ